MNIVVVTTLDEARAALTRNPAAILESPPGAAGFQGIGWWRALLNALGEDGKRTVLDCGDSPGHALEAIRAGIPCIRLRAEPAVFAKVRAIAEQADIRVVPPAGG